MTMTTQLILHILRNPYGWSEENQREARLAAADVFEGKASNKMIHEYFVIQRGGRKTSGHEAEELQTMLDEYSKEGWRLHTIIRHNDVIMDVIFEREKRQ